VLTHDSQTARTQIGIEGLLKDSRLFLRCLQHLFQICTKAREGPRLWKGIVPADALIMQNLKAHSSCKATEYRGSSDEANLSNFAILRTAWPAAKEQTAPLMCSKSRKVVEHDRNLAFAASMRMDRGPVEVLSTWSSRRHDSAGSTYSTG
jgi:hypothetical protein